MTEANNQPATVDLQALQRRIAVLEQRELQRMRADEARNGDLKRRFRFLALGGAAILVAAILVTAAEVVSQSCPSGLTCFSGGTPALASEVNGNFAQVVDWIVQKVGAVGSENVSISGDVSIAGAQVELAFAADSENVAIRGANNAGNLHIESGRTSVTNDVYINHYNHETTHFGGDVVLDGGANGTGGKTLTVGGLSVAGKNIDTYIKDYLAAHCSVWLGFRDSCANTGSACAILAPPRWARIGVNGGTAAAGGDAWTWAADNWAGFETDGIGSNGDELLYIKFTCD